VRHYSGEQCADMAQMPRRAFDLVTEQEIVVELMGEVRERGDLTRIAKAKGLHQATLSNILTGGRPIGAEVAEKLGFRKVIRFERIG
jgi:hypothetical protein